MEIHHETMGFGPNVLLVSGLNGRARFWDAAVERLADRFRLVSFDQRGCGASADDGVDWTVESLAEDALALAGRVFADAPYAAVGHSTGGAVAQVMAAHRPERLKGLVLSGTWIQADAYMQALFGLRLALLERAPDLEPILGNLLRLPPEGYADPDPAVALEPQVMRRRILALLGYQGAKVAPCIAVPTLVIGAEDDRIVPIKLSQDLAASIPGAALRALPEGGHFFPQTRPEAFCDRIGGWLGPLF